jgi:hypothetical protein
MMIFRIDCPYLQICEQADTNIALRGLSRSTYRPKVAAEIPK